MAEQQVNRQDKRLGEPQIFAMATIGEPAQGECVLVIICMPYWAQTVYVIMFVCGYTSVDSVDVCISVII